MDLMPSHKIRMGTPENLEKTLGDFKDRRGPHLEKLKPIEEKIRKHAPLQCSYDISRTQPPYFGEFTYTEMLGGLMVSPQSAEISARMLQYALQNDSDKEFLAVEAIMDRPGKLDKYNLTQAMSKPDAKKIIFAPGSNLMHDCLSRDIVSKLMFKDEEIIIKPHPLTNEVTMRDFGLAFGYNRIVGPEESGMDYLKQAEKVWVTTSTEMGLYACLFRIPFEDVTSYPFESKGAYAHFYRMLWDHSIGEKREILVHLLSSPYSGWYHPKDPNYEQKLIAYFEKAMELRQFFKPLMSDLSIGEYSMAVAQRGKVPLPLPQKRKENAVPNR